MKPLCIERQKGEVDMIDMNILVDKLTDMEELEYWEDRLERLGEDFVIAFSKNRKGLIQYIIYANVKSKGSSFKCSIQSR